MRGGEEISIEARQLTQLSLYHILNYHLTSHPYTRFIRDQWPLKTEECRAQLVVGGDKLIYISDSGSPTTTLAEIKLLINSVILYTKYGSCFLVVTLKPFSWLLSLENPEYMKANLKLFPTDIREKYAPQTLLHIDDFVYININKVMYGLK